jgi:hypothetical protein
VLRTVPKLAALTIALAIAVLALALAACGGDDDEGGKRLPQPGKNAGSPLQPGKYETSRFDPKTSFEVKAGWETATSESPDYFDVAKKGSFEVISFLRPQRVFAPSLPIKGNVLRAPEDTVEWLRSHPRLRVQPGEGRKVDGEDATVLDATVASAPKGPFPDECNEQPCVPLWLPSDNVSVNYRPGDRARFYVVKVDDETVVIAVAGSADKFAGFQAEADALLDSVKFD